MSAAQFLTDKTLFSATLDNADLIHVVDVSDTSQNAAGSSYRLTLAQLKAFVTPATPNLNAVLSAGALTDGQNIEISPADAIAWKNAGATFTTYLTNDQATTGNRTVYLPIFDGTLTYKTTTLTQNYVLKAGANEALTASSLIYDNGTNVGIGTASPINLLHIYKSDANSYDQLWIENANTNNNTGLRLKCGTEALPQILRVGSTNSNINSNYRNNMLFDFAAWNNTQQNDYSFVLYSTATNQSFRIISDATDLSNGHSGTFFQAYSPTKSIGIGLGSSNPTARTHIKGSTADSSAYALMVDNSSGSAVIHSRNDGVVLMPNLPTSSAGLPSGALWNNSGVINIV